ncbi:hypothetical protein TorRG33x02_308810 [Trema orientale]|uniref:Uncharacterized protein n=1 Tax=Trema orientale TaxID=63057 RepID=A0A2P5BU31_TREOI|nr:hypothetical protein TorRG33x02_308810 [Trema orientale]
MVNFRGRLVIIGHVFPPDDDYGIELWSNEAVDGYGLELWYYKIEVKRIGNGQLSGRVLSSQELPPLPLVHKSLSISL